MYFSVVFLFGDLVIMSQEKHIRQILLEMSNKYYASLEFSECTTEEDEKEKIQKEVKRKESIMKKISCPNCGSPLASILDVCDFCETLKKMELGERM